MSDSRFNHPTGSSKTPADTSKEPVVVLSERNQDWKKGFATTEQFHSFYQRIVGRLRRTVHSLFHAEVAADIVIDKLMEASPTQAQLGSYTNIQVRHREIDRQRLSRYQHEANLGRFGEHDEGGEDPIERSIPLIDRPMSPEEVVLEKESHEYHKALLMQGINSCLTLPERACIIGAYLQQKSSEQIAEEQQMTISNVNTTKSRAKKKLLKYFLQLHEKQGVELPWLSTGRRFTGDLPGYER